MRKKLPCFLSNRLCFQFLFNDLRISSQAMESGGEDDDLDLWRPPWETDTADQPPGALRRRQPVAQPDDRHPLLAPLARAQDAVARLEARIEAASPAVAEGARARMSY